MSGPGEFSVGEVLNAQWRLESVLGRGGMGSVWEATELKLGRKVAVKTLHPNLIQEEAVKRFEREAQVMARLDHPNVVSLYAFSQQGGVPFIVMRYLEGANLRAVLRENGGKLTWAQFRPLLRQLCDALAYIHQKGIVHRDLKLSNLFLGPDGWLTLLDLGLARGHHTTLTRTGMVWGTLEFISPEQITAEKHLDGRADLYALGGVVFKALSGEYPFAHSEDQQLLQAHLRAPRPSVHEVNPQLPPGLSLVLQKAMAIAPDQRFQTAGEFLAACDRAFLRRPPSGAVLLGEPAAANEPTRRNRPVGSAATEPALETIADDRPEAGPDQTVSDAASPEAELPAPPAPPAAKLQPLPPAGPEPVTEPGPPRKPGPAVGASTLSLSPTALAVGAGVLMVLGFLVGRCGQ